MAYYTPAPLKVEWGYTGFTPMSVWKNYWLNSFHTWHLPLWGETLDTYTFSCSLPHFRPSDGQMFGRKWGFQNFLEKKKLLAQFISYLAFTLMGWASCPLYIFVFLDSFSALWWPNIWSKMVFPELLEKTIGSIYFFFLKNSHLCSTRLQNRNLYWIFLDEVGSDQSGGILSPFMGTACCQLDLWEQIFSEIWVK